MKLISLNIWGGRIHQPLRDFINRHKNVDIFCFQEIYHNAPDQMTENARQPVLNIFNEIKGLLPEHNAFFRPVLRDCYGIGMFVKKSINVLEEGDIIIHDRPEIISGGAHSRNLQWANCRSNNKTFHIINVHGLWNGMGKTDTADRITQSQKIKNFVSSVSNPKVLCGDFNLRPDTQSIQMLEDGLTNLIKKFNISSTRTSFYDKSEKFADYAFISPDVKINDFRILPDEVSDHAAMYLEFE